MEHNLPCVEVALNSNEQIKHRIGKAKRTVVARAHDLGYVQGVQHTLRGIIFRLEQTTDIQNLDYFRNQLELIKE
jgi:hypothetical protein